MCFLATKKVGVVLVLKSSNKVNCGYRNSWSDEGVSTIRVNDTVQCETTHLTSFAVLVDTQGTTATTSTTSVIVQQVELTYVNDICISSGFVNC